MNDGFPKSINILNIAEKDLGQKFSTCYMVSRQITACHRFLESVHDVRVTEKLTKSHHKELRLLAQFYFVKLFAVLGALWH